MLAKVPAKRADKRSSFASLNKYISGDKLDRETGEILRSAEDVRLETNCLSAHTASAEMRAAADANPRVKDPVYHCILSWQAGEHPTDEQVIEAAKAAQKAVGMEGHQYVYAIHRDTDNAHVHMMLNRVHPDTAKSVYPDRDFYKLDKCMREVELKQGWAHDKGPHEVKNGRIVRAEQIAEAPPLPTKAKDFEAATGHESLITYAQSVKADALEAVKKGSWQELHSTLRKHGLEIKEAGQGFKIYSLTDKTQTPIKASDMAGELGGGKLKKALGTYEKPLRVVESQAPERTYNKYRERTAEKQAERDAARDARAEARRDLRTRFDKFRAEQPIDTDAEARKDARRAALKLLSAEARAARAKIKAQHYGPDVEKAMLSVAAMEAVQKRERLKAQHKAERMAEKAAGYRAWVGDQAEKGDAAALSQLKGWQYDEQRKRKAAEKAEDEAAARAALQSEARGYYDPEPPTPFTDGITWKADRKTGDVLYQLNGKDALKDTGRQVAVLAQQDEQTIAAGLLLAAQKFGSNLTLTGSPEFQKLAIETAVKNGLLVTFADPANEKYRQALVEQQKAKAGRQVEAPQVKPTQQNRSRGIGG